MVRFVFVQFPMVTDPPDLESVHSAMLSGYRVSRVRVDETAQVDSDLWTRLVQDFRQEHELWSGKGGLASDYVGAGDRPSHLQKSMSEIRRWLAGSYACVVEIENVATQERFFVDAQGHRSAHCVGVAFNSARKAKTRA